MYGFIIYVINVVGYVFGGVNELVRYVVFLLVRIEDEG